MDFLANVLSSIKNSSDAGRKFVEVPHSIMAEQVVKILKDEGYVEGVKVFKPEGSPFKKIHVDIKYESGLPKISRLKRVSKPGRRVFSASKKIRRVMGGYGMSIVSTSRGLMKGTEAKKKRLGGEVVCEVF